MPFKKFLTSYVKIFNVKISDKNDHFKCIGCSYTGNPQ